MDDINAAFALVRAYGIRRAILIAKAEGLTGVVRVLERGFHAAKVAA